ncbi:MAG: hypothetical protein GAK30_01755 [Paracidovorax wautersii]|uniref:Chalcone isomerase domain-containing protein n=1 Tax=Paracidovorax wautersii TaxID=1177982 RepID=A0A7V8JQR4_9BURK|nr:MAG: hypothetical protein GAK30_01755 [Paracidovorax wautersii]
MPLARPLPSVLLQAQPGPWQLQGQGALRWSVLRLYEARLYVNVRTGLGGGLADFSVFEQASPFVLEMTYLRNLAAHDIVLAAHQEIERLRPGIDRRLLDEWCVELEACLPDLLRRDRLSTLFLPKEGVSFYCNDDLVGCIDSADFCEAFAAIWLDPATRQPALRQALLGQG